MEKVLISELMRDDSTLMHFNPNHDALGRFASSSGVAIRSSVSKIKSKSASLKEGAANSSKKVKTAVADIKKSRKQKQEEVKSQRISDEKTARERKLKAAEVVKSGNAKLVLENKEYLTDKQLQEAINRIGTERTLKALMAEQNPTKLQKVAKTADKLRTAANMAESGIQAYNQVARVANAVLGENENGNRNNVLPYIGNAQNSYKKEGGISAQNRDFITSATKISDLMNAAGKFNAAEAKLAQDKAMSIDKLRQLSQAEAKNAKDMQKRAEAEAREIRDNRIKAEAEYAKARAAAEKARQDYLKTSISTLSDYRNKTDIFKPTLNATNEYRFEKEVSSEPRNVSKDIERRNNQNFNYKNISEATRDSRTSKDILNTDSKLFNVSSDKNDAFDDYFENEVKKRNKNKK